MRRTIYMPSSIRKRKEAEDREAERKKAWGISTKTEGLQSAFKRGPFFKEEEVLECEGETGDFIFEIPSQDYNPWPKWEWKGSYWKRTN